MAVSKNIHNKIVGYAKQKRVAYKNENVKPIEKYRDNCKRFEGFVDAIRSLGYINEEEAHLYKSQFFDEITLF